MILVFGVRMFAGGARGWKPRELLRSRGADFSASDCGHSFACGDFGESPKALLALRGGEPVAVSAQHHDQRRWVPIVLALTVLRFNPVISPWPASGWFVAALVVLLQTAGVEAVYPHRPSLTHIFHASGVSGREGVRRRRLAIKCGCLGCGRLSPATQ
jgi:hypothetical protein